MQWKPTRQELPVQLYSQKLESLPAFILNMPQRYRGRIIHDRGFQMLTINSKSLKFIQNFENNLKKYKNRFKKAGNWKVGLSLDVSVSDMKFSQEIKSKSSGIFNFTKKNITNIWDMAWKFENICVKGRTRGEVLTLQIVSACFQKFRIFRPSWQNLFVFLLL